MNKMQIAHEYALEMLKETLPTGSLYGSEARSVAESIVKSAFALADMMQAEAEDRNKAEAAQKRKEIREMLNDANTFIERKGQHFDDMEEREPDWSQAPDNAKYWAMDGCGQCNWYARKPEVCGNQWDFGRVIEQAHTGCGYQGNWKNSLRKRPQ